MKAIYEEAPVDEKMATIFYPRIKIGTNIALLDVVERQSNSSISDGRLGMSIEQWLQRFFATVGNYDSKELIAVFFCFAGI